MNKKGFTLIELIAAISIMVIISIIVTVNITRMASNNIEKRQAEFERQLQDAACVYIDLASNREYKALNCSSGCSVSSGSLIDEGLISADLINPETDEKVARNISISISWDNEGVKTCTIGD